MDLRSRPREGIVNPPKLKHAAKPRRCTKAHLRALKGETIGEKSRAVTVPRKDPLFEPRPLHFAR